MRIVSKEPEQEAVERAKRILKGLLPEEKYEEILKKANEYTTFFNLAKYSYPQLRAIAKAVVNYLVEQLSKFPFFRVSTPELSPYIYIDVFPYRMESATKEELKEALRILDLAYTIADSIKYTVKYDDCGPMLHRVIEVTAFDEVDELEEAYLSFDDMKRMIWKAMRRKEASHEV